MLIINYIWSSVQNEMDVCRVAECFQGRNKLNIIHASLICLGEEQFYTNFVNELMASSWKLKGYLCTYVFGLIHMVLLFCFVCKCAMKTYRLSTE